MRICSLLPGATEIVAALGRTKHLVGISHECDYPQEIRTKPVLVRAAVDAEQLASAEIDRRVRGMMQAGQPLYELNETMFSRVRPDLVIAQDLCHVCAVTPDDVRRVIGALPVRPKLLTLNPVRLDDVLDDVERIGDAIERSTEARALAAALRERMEAVRRKTSGATAHPTVVCLEWLDPLYVAGHWVPDMVALAGGKGLLGTAGEPSARIEWGQVLAAQPDVLVIMPCGYSIDRTMRELHCLTAQEQWPRLKAAQDEQVFVVEAAAYFSRPGPRLVEGVEKLAALLHPGLFGETPPAGTMRITTPVKCHE